MTPAMRPFPLAPQCSPVGLTIIAGRGRGRGEGSGVGRGGEGERRGFPQLHFEWKWLETKWREPKWLRWVHSEGVHEIVRMQECKDGGKKLLDLIWVDTDKSRSHENSIETVCPVKALVSIKS